VSTIRTILCAALLVAAPIASAQTSSSYLRPFTYTSPTTPTISVPSATPRISAPSTSYSYDWKSGNRYTTTRNVDGTVTVNGSNLRTGSRWRTTIDSSGNMRGTDKNFNPWSYNRSTGMYINYGTGTMCVGQGAARTCF